MKTSMTIKSITVITLLAAAFAAPVLAQGGPGMGGGMGGGPCMQNGAAGSGAPGMGNGGGRGMRFNQNNTRGWTLMTPEERSAFQIKMREVKTYDECVALQTEHRGALEVRAKEQGVNLQAPRRNACDNMKARGLVK
jgi:hypothetical protein